MQGLVVVGLIVEKIWNVNINCVKVTGARNIGQGQCTCRQEVRDMLCKV